MLEYLEGRGSLEDSRNGGLLTWKSQGDLACSVMYSIKNPVSIEAERILVNAEYVEPSKWEIER